MGTHLNTKSKRTATVHSVWFTIVLAMTASACASSSDSISTSYDEEQSSPTESQPDPATETTSGGAGAYILLSEYQASKNSYSESKVVLFFNATWCSTCEKARSNIEADLSAIPADLAIVLVDFDSETDLKRQYGVTVQHTFVQIDVDGNELAKWSGSLTPQEITENTV